jgi:hypothetical protein
MNPRASSPTHPRRRAIQLLPRASWLLIPMPPARGAGPTFNEREPGCGAVTSLPSVQEPPAAIAAASTHPPQRPRCREARTSPGASAQRLLVGTALQHVVVAKARSGTHFIGRIGEHPRPTCEVARTGAPTTRAAALPAREFSRTSDDHRAPRLRRSSSCRGRGTQAAENRRPSAQAAAGPASRPDTGCSPDRQSHGGGGDPSLSATAPPSPRLRSQLAPPFADPGFPRTPTLPAPPIS